MTSSKTSLPMTTILVVALLSLVGVTADTASLAGQSDPGVVVTGRVVDGDGAPVAGANVEARGPVTRTSSSAAGGRFRFAGLPEGRYVLQVTRLGYEGPATTVQVRGGMSPVELVLDAAPILLEPLRVVSTVRGGRAAVSLPIKIDVVEPEAVATQQALATNPTEMLANLIPSFSPGRQKLTSAGESFRGRRPLFLIDGVPQSNPLRDGRRDGFTIGMDAVERVEVVFGANAIQGLGATGGIVNYITVSPPTDGRFEQRLSVSTTVDDGFSDNGAGYRANYTAGNDFGAVDAVVSVGWEERGLFYDAQGRTIGLDNVQGDIADSGSRNLFAKVGWEPTPGRRLQVSVSDFRLAQNGDFELVAGDRAAGIPATAEAGDPQGDQPVNDITTLSLDYADDDVAGGSVSAQLYWQDFAALYGGGVFGVFQDPALAPVGSLFEQSENNSEKLGLRATWAGRPVASAPVDVIAGFDLLRDRTFQRLVQTNRNWVPETTFRNLAPFVQADIDVSSALDLSAGIRWEVAELDVPDFTTIAGNRDDFETLTVQGGAPSFNEPLLNLGAVLTPLEGLRLYGTFSQAYSMPDVGRVLRGVSQPGTAVESFLALEPVKTDNVEAGAVHSTATTRFGVTWFQSESDFGTRLVPNADGIFEVFREPTRTRGWEFTGRVDPTRDLSVQAAWSILEGSFDADDDSDYDSDLGAGDIGPDRLNVSVDWNAPGPLSTRLQLQNFFDRTFEDADRSETARFDGYRTLDASVAAQLQRLRVTLGIANLLDEQYVTYFGQAATGRDDRFFAGRGRALTLRLDTTF